jgi:hypothetical protein
MVPLVKRSVAIGALGWIGVAGTLGAYILVSFSALSPTGILYQAINLISAAFIALETWTKRDYQPFWLNVIWASIALVALVRIVILL